jgi:hypothetical protein
VKVYILSIHLTSDALLQKVFAVLALAASATAFAPQAKPAFVTNLKVDPNPKPLDGSQAQEMGWSMGGEAHTRDPKPVVDTDPRKTIPEGESFEEYMKRRAAGN